MNVYNQTYKAGDTQIVRNKLLNNMKVNEQLSQREVNRYVLKMIARLNI